MTTPVLIQCRTPEAPAISHAIRRGLFAERLTANPGVPLSQSLYAH